MTAVDTSVVLPALLSWHEHHESCRSATQGAALPAHVGLESYSVMTRLPSPHRVSPATAAALIEGWFSGRRLLAPERLQRELVVTVSELGIAGGSVYDALVGLTAKAANEELLSRDERAVRTYKALGVSFRLLG